MKCGILLPARLASTRLPRKMLLDLGGAPLVVRSYENARRARGFDAVAVATDNDEIAAAVTAAGGLVLRTSSEHRTGTERCAEAAKILGLDLIVNVQADEPFVDPRDIEAVLAALRRNPHLEMATLRIPLHDEREYLDPNVVKVVCTTSDLALYFSRAPIPYDRERQGAFRTGFRHIGVYGYRLDFLVAFAASCPLALETIESLEQLRALDMGARILVVDAHGAPIGIDTQEDLERARARWRTPREVNGQHAGEFGSFDAGI